MFQFFQANIQCNDDTSINLESIGEISGVKHKDFSVCLVYKAASTQWLRLIKYLNGQSNTTHSPYNISKYQTHYTNLQNIPYFHYENLMDKRFLEGSTRVLTVRDPYSRLWSAYIDKFLLQDFWTSRGTYIITHYRPKASRRARMCGKSVTFKEFIQFVVDLNGKTLKFDQDKHWLPASSMCNPCIYRPNYILKSESLSHDFYRMIEILNIGDVNEIIPINFDFTEFEMRDQLNYVYLTLPEKECADLKAVLRLTWKAFQYNAYIPDDIPFPKDLAKLEEHRMLDILKKIHHTWTATRDSRQRQKRKWMIKAYKALPKSLLETLRHRYMDDFRIFGYEDMPPDIFN